jgi:predicted PurR-regulated permease PerM
VSTSRPSDSTEHRVTRYILIGIALLAVAALLWRVRQALVIAFGAIVFATALRALADTLRRRIPCPEKVSVAMAIGLLLVVFSLLAWLFGAQAADQFAELHQRLPGAIEKFKSWLAGSPMGSALVDAVKQMGVDGGGGAASSINHVVTAIFGGVGHLLIIVFAGAYFALDPALYREGALRLLPPSRRSQVRNALNDAGGALRKWLVAQLLVMTCVGVLSGIGLALIGVPLALSLGLLVGILEFVPMIGPIVAAVPGVLLAFAKGPEAALYAVLVYTAVQQIETNVLTPLIQRWAVELPPVVALLSIVAGGLLFGVLGVLFATPLAVVVMTLVQHLYVEDTLENGPKKIGRSARP